MRQVSNHYPTKKNEFDWKADLSDKGDKIAQHISAFANHPGGGFFVFGVNNDGIPVGVRNHDYSEIVKRLGNIARDGVVSSVAIDHSDLPTPKGRSFVETRNLKESDLTGEPG